jgi:hypothetical protein
MTTLRATAAAPWMMPVRDAARDAFLAQEPGRRFAPVLVLIAALNERESLGQTLAEIPSQACGGPLDVLVVDDGSTDDTGAVAARGGAHVARLERNLGHGVALRLGYELADRLGAEIVVTLDADGQWNPAELAGVLEPVVAGDADFVIGSRVLGATETDDGFRQTGVHVFAWLVRTLTGVPVTDTSSGFRAMRVVVTQTVPQRQMQYQTSELLIGAIARGYRIAERPIVMRKRIAGESKKGHNVLYGFRYARVVLTTAWRERAGLHAQRRARG